MRHVLIVVALAVFLGGCHEPATMKAYTGPDQSDAQLAILDDSHCGSSVYNILGELLQYNCIYLIKKGDHVYYDGTREFALTFRLQPGEYLITHGPERPLSGPRASRLGPPVGVETRLDLRAGHTYSTRWEFCSSMYGGCFPSRSYYWIQDDTTGNVLDGTKP